MARIILYSLLLVAAFVGCSSEHSTTNDLSDSSDPPASPTPEPSIPAPPVPLPFELEPIFTNCTSDSPMCPLEPNQGWTELDIDNYLCHHPAVEMNCTDGWCIIPAGCFIMGSPETEYHHAMYSERLTPVEITHSFEIQRYEMTQKQWGELVSVNPSGNGPEISNCIDDNCPVGNVSWFDALTFANLMSDKHDPPLRHCYELDDCQGEIETGDLSCSKVQIDTSLPIGERTVSNCEGYRLPTEAEWEYAARAGTRTAYYSGDTTYDYSSLRIPYEPFEPNLEPIAWYYTNTGGAPGWTHKVGLKAPNQWGLYDMLGNVEEWTNDIAQLRDGAGPLFDPVFWWHTNTYAITQRVAKGTNAIDAPECLRAAGFYYFDWDARGPGIGFRLVRTLP